MKKTIISLASIGCCFFRTVHFWLFAEIHAKKIDRNIEEIYI